MIYVMLPAYNEAREIEELVCRIFDSTKRHLIDCRTVIVDDGSSDDTYAIATSLKDRFPIEVIKHQVNKGLGEGLKTGFSHITSIANPEDIIFVMDADNTHPPDLMVPMAKGIENGSDIVIASRYRKGSQIIGVPFYRQVLSVGASWLFRIFIPVKGARDFTGGYRAYRVSLIKKALQQYGDNFISESGFSCMIDILLKLNRLNPVITEVPITLEYSKKKGPSKMKIGKAVKSTMKLFFRQLF